MADEKQSYLTLHVKFFDDEPADVKYVWHGTITFGRLRVAQEQIMLARAELQKLAITATATNPVLPPMRKLPEYKHVIDG